MSSARSDTDTGRRGEKRSRSRSRSRSRDRAPDLPPKKRDYRRRSGERGSGSSPDRSTRGNPSCSTASRTSRVTSATWRRPNDSRDGGRMWGNKNKKNKTNPYEVFSQHMAKFKPDKSYCGFYWHSCRLARKGTDYIFTEGMRDFQKRCKDNKCEWKDVREILFGLKKVLDQGYRNMMYHFRHTQCEKCNYWDEVYKMHLANVSPSETEPQELTDEEMLAAAMEVDGAHE
nr:NP1 [Porcine bocavirus]